MKPAVTRTILALLGALLLCAAGCLTPPAPRKEMRVVVLSDGRIQVMGRNVTHANLPKTVKAMGGTGGTRITISAHWKVSDQLLNSMQQSLIKARFPRTYVAKKKRPQAYVGTKEKYPNTQAPKYPGESPSTQMIDGRR